MRIHIQTLHAPYCGPEIKPGSVVVAYSNDALKWKWHLVIGISDDGTACLAVLFNTRKPFPNVPHLVKLQCHLSKATTPFLKHDCYANCAHPVVKPVSELQDVIKLRANNFKGNISIRKLDEIRTFVANAITVAPNDVKDYGLEPFLIE
ncbi:MAG: hypothetical protein JXR56_00720 [Candidatus Cloacimonetes bacterium]|nr:hypothetical protein [Candidatus Cloacimonadota bacterium]